MEFYNHPAVRKLGNPTALKGRVKDSFVFLNWIFNVLYIAASHLPFSHLLWGIHFKISFPCFKSCLSLQSQSTQAAHMLSLKSSDFWVGKTSAVHNGCSYCLPPPSTLPTDLPIPFPSAASEPWHRDSWQCHFRYSSPVSPLLSVPWT